MTAGRITTSPSLTPEKFNMIININTGGTYSIIRTFVPLLNLSKSATIVNVSSVSAFTGSGSNIAYCAAKAAIDTMTISLARAFYRQSKFLILDEATSALDNRTEAEVMDAIDIIGRRCTIVIIAHRLSTVMRADCIYEFKNGQIVASGNYQDLIENSDSFRETLNTAIG